MDWRIALLVGVIWLVLFSVGANALDLFASLFSFEMSGQRNVFLNDNETTGFAVMAFHESSQSWLLYLRHNESDAPPYDNFDVSFDCAGIGSGSFNTTSYADWVSHGALSVNMEYQSANFSISYNQVPFSAKYARCDVNILTFPDSFSNNSAYAFVQLEYIPQTSVIESAFLPCDQAVSSQLFILGEINTLVGMDATAWQLGWITYSIFIIILAVFALPIFIIILIRYILFKLTGYKLGSDEE